MVHMSRECRLDPIGERKRYETHENDSGDPGYRRFLARLADPLVALLSPGATGLDYGSGPGPTLSVMLEEKGFLMSIYDPFFAPDRAALSRTYDFITCTETVEHFFDPGDEFERLSGLLRSGGRLALMTEILGAQEFDQWRYVRDATHVSFYRSTTMEWLASHFGWSIERPEATVVFFKK